MGLTEGRSKFHGADWWGNYAELLQHVGGSDAPWYLPSDGTEYVWSIDEGYLLIAHWDFNFEMTVKADKIYRGEQYSMVVVSQTPMGGRRIFLSNKKER